MYSVIAFDAMRTDEEHLLATPVKMGSFTSPYIQWHVKKIRASLDFRKT